MRRRRGFLEGHFNTYSAAPDRPPWYGEFKAAFCYEFPDNGYCIGPTPEGALQVAALFLPYGFVAKTLTKVVGAGIAARAATPELGGAVAAGAAEAGVGANAARVAAAGCSFVPGTRVLMADGTSKPIEQLQVGDMVLATDPETGETGPREVLAPLSSEGLKTLVQITIDTDGAIGDQTGVLTATDNHPFWAPDLRMWVTAKELRAGSLLQASAGAKVQAIAVRIWAAPHRVHNLTVADLHTYYVLAGKTAVLVHNSNGACGVVGIPNLHGKGLVDAEQDIFGHGFKFTSETKGGYRRYDHSDGSQIWIRPDGEVQRLGPKIDPGPNQKNYRQRYGPDGQVTQEHSTGEMVIR